MHKKTNNKWIDVKFFGILGTFTGHSISLGVDNGSLDGELHPQFMIKKKILTSMIKKKRNVINFNRRDKSLKKNTIYGITS